MTSDRPESVSGSRDAAPRSARGAIALDVAACTACDLCAVECPAWCIEMSSHPETRADGPGRPRKVKVLDEFSIDFGLCIYCGICIQVCPFDALAWVPEPPTPAHREETADGSPLVIGRDELASWWPPQQS